MANYVPTKCIPNLYFDKAENSDDDFAIICYTYAAKYGHPEAQKIIEELKKKGNTAN